jgi:hypothetical protein
MTETLKLLRMPLTLLSVASNVFREHASCLVVLSFLVAIPNNHRCPS